MAVGNSGFRRFRVRSISANAMGCKKVPACGGPPFAVRYVVIIAAHSPGPSRIFRKQRMRPRNGHDLNQVRVLTFG
jgi:hypothetical protein